MYIDNKEFYSITEFAIKIRVHPNTVRRAIKSGSLLAIRMGTPKKWIYRIPSNEIKRMFSEGLEEHILKKVDERIDARTTLT